MEDLGGSARITVRARGWWKWGGALVLQGVAGGIALLLVGAVAVAFFSKKRGERLSEDFGGMVIGGVILAFVAYWFVLSGWARQEYVVEPGRVTIQRRLGSWTYWPQSDYPSGRIVVIPMTREGRQVVCVAYAAGGKTTLSDLFTVTDASLGAVGVLHRASAGR